jgi:maltose-binding protein MalE
MKRIALVIGIFLVVGATAALGADTFVVGVEQSTKDAWQTLGTQFQEMTGIAVSVQPLAQNSIAQQVTLQAFTKSGRLNFVMVSSSWASSIARYLQDLSNYVSTLSAQGITPISQSGRVVGVPIAFAQGWFLGVLTWPQNVDGAVDFLVAAALGASTSG